MEIKRYLLTKNQCYTNARYIKPTGIMLHSVGCAQPDPLAFLQNWNNPNVEVCVHGFISPDSVYQALPWNVKAWHCGGTGNSTHIGIEMTEPATIKYTGGANFIDLDPEQTREHIKATYRNAVIVFAALCKEYGIDPIKGIVSHKEGHKMGIASNHGDPEHLWSKYPDLGFTMDNFRMEVFNMVNSKENEEVRAAVFDISGTGDTPSPNFKEACEWAKKEGIFAGDGSGNFGWDKGVTREQLAAILFRLTGK